MVDFNDKVIRLSDVPEYPESEIKSIKPEAKSNAFQDQSSYVSNSINKKLGDSFDKKSFYKKYQISDVILNETETLNYEFDNKNDIETKFSMKKKKRGCWDKLTEIRSKYENVIFLFKIVGFIIGFVIFCYLFYHAYQAYVLIKNIDRDINKITLDIKQFFDQLAINAPKVANDVGNQVNGIFNPGSLITQ
ncbi:hypothetical protein HDU92_008451 [Lobulomyces angularis]|nr:hypothetical protein HDU92_008451 [Lobulomyces angularis]